MIILFSSSITKNSCKVTPIALKVVFQYENLILLAKLLRPRCHPYGVFCKAGALPAPWSPARCLRREEPQIKAQGDVKASSA